MIQHLLFVVGVIFSLLLFSTSVVSASSSLVISHIQTGGTGSGTSGQEFVAVYNNLPVMVDVTDWCLKYSDYTNTSVSELYCFQRATEADAVLMGSHAFSVVVSQSLPISDTSTITGQYKNTSTAMSGTRGHVSLYDHTGNIIDRVAWDNGASSPPSNPELKAAIAPVGGNMLVRELSENQYIDTNNNYDDFVSVLSVRPTASYLIDYMEPPVEVDLCENLDGMQLTLPPYYGYDELNNCYPDAQDKCLNLDLIQISVPLSLVLYENNCYEADADHCPNIDGFQLDMPVNHRMVQEECRPIVGIKKIIISEVLANSIGSDIGNEFIELYNSDVAAISLNDYILYVGKNSEKQIALPNVTIQPNSFAIFSDTDLGFSLLNTTTNVELHYYDGTLVDEIIPYQDPAEEIAWAIIDDVWQYTNEPTPGTENLPSVEEVLAAESNNEGLAPCPEGKYRNPLTNRCRNIEADASVLATCDSDEYRSPDTNRCRKITLAGTTLTPCEEGYERNPETNRCRKVAQATALIPCQNGYERNQETNRCRKIIGNTVSANNQHEQLQSVAGGIALDSPYIVAATAGIGAVGYGLYEWRTELASVIRRILSVFAKK